MKVSPHVSSVTNPLGHTAKYVYDKHQRVIQTVDEEGNITSYEHDPKGNVTAILSAIGGRIAEAKRRIEEAKEKIARAEADIEMLDRAMEMLESALQELSQGLTDLMVAVQGTDHAFSANMQALKESIGMFVGKMTAILNSFDTRSSLNASNVTGNVNFNPVTGVGMGG